MQLVYWTVRPHEAAGNSKRAGAPFASLSGERGYCGFLSADRLERPYALNVQTSSLSVTELATLTDSRGMHQAKELLGQGAGLIHAVNGVQSRMIYPTWVRLKRPR